MSDTMEATFPFPFVTTSTAALIAAMCASGMAEEVVEDSILTGAYRLTNRMSTCPEMTIKPRMTKMVTIPTPKISKARSNLLSMSQGN